MTSQHVLSKTKISEESRGGRTASIKMKKRKGDSGDWPRRWGRWGAVTEQQAVGRETLRALWGVRQKAETCGEFRMSRRSPIWHVRKQGRAHTQVNSKAWQAGSCPPSAPAARQPRQRSGCVDVHSTALRCFDRQTAFSISVSVLVVPCGSSDLSSSPRPRIQPTLPELGAQVS